MTGAAINSNAIIMRRPDGTPMSREEVIIQRRGAFKWLPVLCSNDLVHGSWWFMWGSLLTALFAFYPIIRVQVTHERQNDDILPATDFDITWALLIISGTFFTAGSLAFVRAFEEPPKQPLFHNYKHLQSDELLGAWFFLFGTMPAVPYMLVFFLLDPSAFYFFAMIACLVFVLSSYLFVVSCYPSDKKHKNAMLPLFIRLFGPQIWVVRHLANDWLASTWLILWANLLVTMASFLILLVAIGIGNASQTFVWFSGTVCSFLFLVGSYYFVAGSYPHAQQFYYVTGRGHLEDTTGTMGSGMSDGNGTGGNTGTKDLELGMHNKGLGLGLGVVRPPPVLPVNNTINNTISNPLHTGNPSDSSSGNTGMSMSVKTSFESPSRGNGTGVTGKAVPVSRTVKDIPHEYQSLPGTPARAQYQDLRAIMSPAGPTPSGGGMAGGLLDENAEDDEDDIDNGNGKDGNGDTGMASGKSSGGNGGSGHHTGKSNRYHERRHSTRASDLLVSLPFPDTGNTTSKTNNTNTNTNTNNNTNNNTSNNNGNNITRPPIIQHPNTIPSR